MNEMTHFGKSIAGLVTTIFRGMADFVEWASGKGGVHRRPHLDVVEDVPRILTLPLHANLGMVGMEDLV